MEVSPLSLIIPDFYTGPKLQAAVDQAKAKSAAVWIPADYAGSDTYTNPNNVPVFDMRGAGSQTFGAPGVTSVPVQLVSDTFTRANENPLSFSGNWTTIADSVTNAPMQIVNNQVQGTLNSGVLGSTSIWTGVNADLFRRTSNQWAKFTINALGTIGTQNGGVFINVQPNAARLSGISGQVTGQGGALGSGTTQVVITAVSNNLGEATLASTNMLVNAGDTFELDHVGPFCSMKQNGTAIAALTNIWCGSVNGGGLPAIHTYISTGNVNQVILSNFSAGVFGDSSGEAVNDTFSYGVRNPIPVSTWTQFGCNMQSTVTNLIEPTATGTDCFAFYTAQTFPENQSAEIKINTLGAGSFASPVVHGAKNGTHQVGYLLRVPGPTGSSGSVLILRSDASGNYTTIETITSITPQVNDVFKLVAVNTPPNGTAQGFVTLTGYQNDVMIGVPIVDTMSSDNGNNSAIMQGAPGFHMSASGAVTSSQIIGPWQSFSPVNTPFQTIQTAVNCFINGASPAACGTAISGTVVVPTTTTTYTVNSTAVFSTSKIFVWPRTDATVLPGAPTCVAPPTPFIGYVSSRVNATSFTFTLPSTAGTSCWDFSIVN